MSTRDAWSPLPQRIRRYRWETDASYLRRVLTAHHFDQQHSEAYLRQARRRTADGDLVGTLTGPRLPHPLPAVEQQVHACARCLASLQPRWVCVRCTAGAAIPQAPHAGPFVCRRHRIWVAPGTTPEQQHAVGTDVLRADRRWQRLVAAGRGNVLILLELQRILIDWDALTGTVRTPAQRFVLLTQLWSRVTAPTVLEVATRPDVDFSVRYATLRAHINHVLGDASASAPVVDGVWVMLRSTAADRRGDIPAAPAEAHTHPLRATAETDQPPTQPFADYYASLETSRTTRWDDVHQKYVLGRADPGMRWEVTSGQLGRIHLLCANGHPNSGTPNTRRTSHASPSGGCPYCGGRKALPGFRSLLLTHPNRAAFWHPTKNGTTTADQVLAGSGKTAWWVCAKGHEFDAIIGQFVTANNGCPICRGLRIQPGVNDLATTNPALADRWHPTRNRALTPNHVTRWSKALVWWQCASGHEWEAKVMNQKAHRCPVCGNKRVVAGENSLTDTHPQIAAEWHPTKNGARTPETVVIGSGANIWWVCPIGHDYEKSLVRRKAGAGCPYCINKAAWPGFNDAATRYADLIIDWDHTRNPNMDPTRQLPGNKPHWWCCAAAGHITFGTFPNRRLTGGCPQCPKANRAGEPPTT